MNIHVANPCPLYHFTAAHFIQAIKLEGLTKGVLPWNMGTDGRPQLLRNPFGAGIPGGGFQWLTKNPSFDQPFCLQGALPFSKNAFRVTVMIPKIALPGLHSWPEMAARCRPDSAFELNTPAVDWKNWFVYHGPIRPCWFLEVMRNPGETLTPANHIHGAT